MPLPDRELVLISRTQTVQGNIQAVCVAVFYRGNRHRGRRKRAFVFGVHSQHGGDAGQVL